MGKTSDTCGRIGNAVLSAAVMWATMTVLDAGVKKARDYFQSKYVARETANEESEED